MQVDMHVKVVVTDHEKQQAAPAESGFALSSVCNRLIGLHALVLSLAPFLHLNTTVHTHTGSDYR